MVATKTAASNGKAKPTAEQSPDDGFVSVQLARRERVTLEVPIRGTTPLITNRFSEKAKAMMLAAQQTKARAKKEPKDPDALYEAARYRLEDGRDGVPATAFKSAIVDAAREFDGVTLVWLKRSVFVAGIGSDLLVPIEYDAIAMREDAVRNATGVADLRYRPIYTGWRATLHITTFKGAFDVNSILALIDVAGVGGVGEWRPSAPKSTSGTYGQFEVDEDRPVINFDGGAPQ